MKFIGEIIAETNKMETLDQVMNHLKTHQSPALLMLFEAAFHPKIKWMLPPGKPPYTPDHSPYGTHASNLYVEMKRMFQFLNSQRMIVNPVQREKLFIQMLESLPKDESELVILAKDGELSKKYKWITYDNIAQTFAKLLPVVEPAVEVKPVEKKVQPESGGIDLLQSSVPKKKSTKKPAKKTAGKDNTSETTSTETE